MATLVIVKAHDVTKEFDPGLAVRSKCDISTFTFQGRPETLHGGIISTITDTAHTDVHGGSGQSFLVINARVLATAIGMMEHVARRSTLSEGHVQCAFDQFRAQMVSHRHKPYIGVLDPYDYGKNIRFGPWA